MSITGEICSAPKSQSHLLFDPPLTPMKVDLGEQNTPYTTYLHLKQQGKSGKERKKRDHMGH